jgi:uncharacterized ubiquitin-like protein YukD
MTIVPSHPDHDHDHHQHQPDDDVELIVRSPAGASHPFRFELDEFAAQAAATAIAYFVERREIEPGDYALELIRDDKATPIADTSRLGDYDLHDGDQLHLITAKPQVDG